MRKRRHKSGKNARGYCVFTDVNSDTYKKIAKEIQKGIEDGWDVNCKKISDVTDETYTSVLKTFSHMLKNY